MQRDSRELAWQARVEEQTAFLVSAVRPPGMRKRRRKGKWVAPLSTLRPLGEVLARPASARSKATKPPPRLTAQVHGVAVTLGGLQGIGRVIPRYVGVENDVAYHASRRVVQRRDEAVRGPPLLREKTGA